MHLPDQKQDHSSAEDFSSLDSLNFKFDRGSENNSNSSNERQANISETRKHDRSPDRKEAPTPEVPRQNPGKIILISLLAFAGMQYCSRSSSSERAEQQLRESLSQEELSSPLQGLSNIIPGVEKAIEYISQGQFKPEVYELENHFSGQFAYEFTLKELVAAQEKKLILSGLAGDSLERAKLLDALSSAHMIVRNKPRVIDNGQESSGWSSMLPSLIFYGAVIGAFVWIMRRGMKGQMDSLSSYHQAEGEVLSQGSIKDRFHDLGGMDHVIDSMRELQAKINLRMQGNHHFELPTGTLLTGPPGVGKTKLARALAGELKVPFAKFDCSQLGTQMLVGSGPSRVKNAFELARALRDKHTEALRSLPNARGTEEGVAILFLDEFESLGLKRSNAAFSGNADSERLRVVTTLLNEMDGFNKDRNKNIIIFAATNNPQMLDDALLRPGRFTKSIHIDLPRSSQQRLEILQRLEHEFINKKGLRIDSPRSLEYVASITPGDSGDHLRQILIEASELAMLDSRTLVTQDDLFEAAQRASSGRIQKNYLSREQHELVAQHEHGHALNALAAGVNIFLVSMLPRGNSAGRVIPDPKGLAESLTTKKDYLARILIGAGGRAAELEKYGDSGMTNGASSDLDQIRAIIAEMISVGMLGDQYSKNLHHIPLADWGPEQHQLINQIASRSMQYARKIIASVGEQTMDQLVQDSLRLGREVVGDDAQRFYQERVSPETLKKLQSLAQEFFDRPLEN